MPPLDKSTSYQTGVLFAALTSISWAFIPILIKPASLELSSANISFMRLVGGTIGLFLLSRAKPEWKSRIKQAMKPALFAGFLFTYHYWSYVEGIAWSGPALGRVLINLGSVFLALIGLFFFRERLSPLQLFGVICAFIGVATFTLSLYGWSFGDVEMPAVLLLLSSASVWAVYGFLQRHASRENLGSEFLLIMFAIAAILTSFFTAPSQFLNASPLALTSTGILALLTVTGYSFFSKAMSTEIPLTHLTVLTCTSPLLTLILLLLLKAYLPNALPPEGVSVVSLLPATICVLGVYLVVSKKKSLPASSATEKIHK